MTQHGHHRPVLVTSSPAPEVALPGVVPMTLEDFRDALTRIPHSGALVLPDLTVLALALNPEDHAAVEGDAALTALLAAADVPMTDAPGDAAGWQTLALRLLADRLDRVEAQASEDRAALAELRATHMQMQTDHSELEAWVWDALAPKYKQVRAWPVGASVLRLEPGAVVRQPLPLPARGFIAADVHIAQSPGAAGRLAIRLERPTGPAFDGTETSVAVPAAAADWLRLTLPRAPGGMPEDAVLRIEWQPEAEGDTALDLSLAPDSPFPDYRARLGAAEQPQPLALRVFRTLPHQPAPPVHDPRQPAPADGATRLLCPADLPEPTQLPYARSAAKRALRRYPDFTRVEYWEKEQVFFVHPSAARPVVARVNGVKVDQLRQLRATVQIGRHDTLPIAFALGAAPAGAVGSVEEALAHLGPWVHLLPAEWGEVWCEPPAPLSGEIDLLLATAMPGMPFNRNADALFHGFRLTCGQG